MTAKAPMTRLELACRMTWTSRLTFEPTDDPEDQVGQQQPAEGRRQDGDDVKLGVVRRRSRPRPTGLR